MVDLIDHDLNCSFRLINVYVVYVDRVPFWEGVSNLRFLNVPNIILRGDLNFTLSINKVLRVHPRSDPQEIIFLTGLKRTI